jgi:hypothetical protein
MEHIDSKFTIMVDTVKREISIGYTINEIDAQLKTEIDDDLRCYLIIAREILQIRQELAQLRKI